MGFDSGGGGGGGGGGGLTEVATGYFSLSDSDATYIAMQGLTDINAKYIPVLRWNSENGRTPNGYPRFGYAGTYTGDIQMGLQYNTNNGYWRVYIANGSGNSQDGEFSIFKP